MGPAGLTFQRWQDSLRKTAPCWDSLISHPHLDHYGLVRQLVTGVPIYIGREAASLLRAATFFSPVSEAVDATGYLGDRSQLRLGPFTVTPYLIDHSAFDSLSPPGYGPCVNKCVNKRTLAAASLDGQPGQYGEGGTAITAVGRSCDCQAVANAPRAKGVHLRRLPLSTPR